MYMTLSVYIHNLDVCCVKLYSSLIYILQNKMRNPIIVLVVVLIQFISEYSAQRLLQMDIRLAQDIHNWLRSREGAADMNYLNWDWGLQGAAARWAQTCRFEHQYSGRYGENLAFEASTGRLNPRRVMINGMRNWFNEKRLYRYGRGSCGAACHYTQMVWARSDRIGCAMSHCNVIIDPQSGRTYSNAMYLVCFYTPQGNFIGQFPYLRGPPCSRCQRGKMMCMNNLCQGMNSFGYLKSTSVFSPDDI
ncbi:hypothetical protein KUTeg_016089 [Tegillarca granosa]|uniref:SCP domain-containing protein n=1 Tax=Tegillarca granosa TaxID=220873 RepID=A0ABQ9EJU8_TEGGR|nr:hypothetical protein KUTeg_016089 [Tegillarca granosa]